MEEKLSFPIELFHKRTEKAFTKNEITRGNYAKVKLARSRLETIDALHGFIQEELADFDEAKIPKEIKKRLKRFELFSAISGGKRMQDYLETQQLRILQETVRYVWALKDFEPDDVEEAVIVQGVDGRPEGYARYPKDLDLERIIKKHFGEAENGKDVAIPGSEKAKNKNG